MLTHWSTDWDDDELAVLAGDPPEQEAPRQPLQQRAEATDDVEAVW